MKIHPRQTVEKPCIAISYARFLILFVTKSTPGYARGKEKLIVRGEVDKKKAPWYSRSGLPTTQLK